MVAASDGPRVGGAVLVTGSAGFIGRAVANALSASGEHVVRLVRRPTESAAPFTVVDDLSDPARLRDLFLGAGVSTVVHAAWQGHPRGAGMDHVAQVGTNVVPSTNLFVAAAETGVRHVIFLSSGGGQARLHGLRPAYATAKRIVEGLLERIAEQFDMIATVLRPSAVYGPGQDPLGGLGAVAAFAYKLLNAEPIDIFGSVANGRDFLYLDDLAALVLQVCAEPAAGIYPVGGPEVIRLARLVEVLERIIGTPAVIRIVESKAVEPALVDLDNTRVRDQFSWSPEVAIEAGAAAVVDDIRLRFFTDRNAATVE